MTSGVHGSLTHGASAYRDGRCRCNRCRVDHTIRRRSERALALADRKRHERSLRRKKAKRRR